MTLTTRRMRFAARHKLFLWRLKDERELININPSTQFSHTHLLAHHCNYKNKTKKTSIHLGKYTLMKQRPLQQQQQLQRHHHHNHHEHHEHHHQHPNHHSLASYQYRPPLTRCSRRHRSGIEFMMNSRDFGVVLIIPHRSATVGSPSVTRRSHISTATSSSTRSSSEKYAKLQHRSSEAAAASGVGGVGDGASDIVGGSVSNTSKQRPTPIIIINADQRQPHQHSHQSQQQQQQHHHHSHNHSHSYKATSHINSSSGRPPAPYARPCKKTRFLLEPNRRSWSESDLLKEIDSELKLAKGFLYANGGKIYKQNDMTLQVTGRQGNSAMRRQSDTKPMKCHITHTPSVIADKCGIVKQKKAILFTISTISLPTNYIAEPTTTTSSSMFAPKFKATAPNGSGNGEKKTDLTIYIIINLTNISTPTTHIYLEQQFFSNSPLESIVQNRFRTSNSRNRCALLVFFLRAHLPQFGILSSFNRRAHILKLQTFTSLSHAFLCALKALLRPTGVDDDCQFSWQKALKWTSY
ncbi:unnamed protein product [Ceratitis capitata]|uniref:(Mediterranean fruit fly) hypothetical protein n=1 Tax=Ceratitis capitata TaxID=7213 RepID=A0A811VJ20_CERCA|nr:unnamed protein product [Ceratitis capitata]